MRISENRIGIEEEIELFQYVSEKLQSSEFNQGVLEDAATTATNSTEAVGRLLDILAEKGILSLPQIFSIATGYSESLCDIDRKIEET